MIRGLDHIGIAVVSIDDALPVYRDLGLEVAHREEVPAQKVRTAFLPCGDTRLELLEPTADDSPIAKFLLRRGGGLHHLCFEVTDLEKVVEDLAAKGYRLLNRIPSPGADGKRVVFLHPDAGKGVLIELSERGA
jgi:methylmalonyl-CoA/ethylmalonyl-CoA epimerase